MTTTETKKDIHSTPLHYMVWRHPSYCPASLTYHFDADLRVGYAAGEVFVLGYDVPGQGSHEERRIEYLRRHVAYTTDDRGRKIWAGIKPESCPVEFCSGKDLQAKLEHEAGVKAIELGAKYGWE